MPFEEESKAVQEGAKAVQTVAQTLQQLGKFFGRFIEGPLEQWSGQIEDGLRVRRAKNLLRLQVEFERERALLGVDHAEIQHLPLNFAMPALAEASLEDDEEFIGIWARLLARSVDSGSGVEPRRAFVSILQDMTPFDARIFEAIYGVESPDGTLRAVTTYELPERATDSATWKGKADAVPHPSHPVIVALANLERIGVIGFGSSWGGGEIFDFVNQNTMGAELNKAIRRAGRHANGMR